MTRWQWIFVLTLVITGLLWHPACTLWECHTKPIGNYNIKGLITRYNKPFPLIIIWQENLLWKKSYHPTFDLFRSHKFVTPSVSVTQSLNLPASPIISWYPISVHFYSSRRPCQFSIVLFFMCPITRRSLNACCPGCHVFGNHSS